MASVTLEGHTLGERHRRFNELVHHTIAAGSPEFKPINYTDSDLDNLMRIDIACHYRNVNYVLEVLKCEDMLYVSRALKQSKWLITDKKYVYIINPEYLDKELLPHMMMKAIKKLMLQIKINLKDEKRADAFYDYNGKYLKTTTNWLPYCSMSTIKRAIEYSATCCFDETGDINLSLLKRLCKKSFSAFEILIKTYDVRSLTNYYLPNMNSIISKYTEAFLDLVESLPEDRRPYFTEPCAHIILKKCPRRIFDRIDFYFHRLDYSTLAKYIKKEDIENILMTRASKAPERFLNFESLSGFLNYVPRERIYDLLKTIFNHNDSEIEPQNRYQMLFYNLRKKWYFYGQGNVYKWYQYAPFNIALIDLRKLITEESSADERHAMLIVLLKCAAQNEEHIHTVIQYYLESHINEPAHQTSKFVESILSLTKAYRYADKTWNLLNEIFHRMEVYIESDNRNQSCIINIIIYNLLHNQPIPKIVEDKFEFETFKEYRSKLKQSEKQQVYSYLNNYLMKRLDTKVKSEREFHLVLSYVHNFLYLLKDWKKENECTSLFDKINELFEINMKNQFDIDLSKLYNMLKSYRKHFFQISIFLHPCQEVCINALKHDPDLLVYSQGYVDYICCNDDISMKVFLSKLRIYWPQTLSKQWTNAYIEYTKVITGHKALVRGLYTLLPQNELLQFIERNAPEDKKVKWREMDDVQLSVRKHIAKNMHLARPMLPSNIVLLYAKGDYLQFALLSLNSINSNMKFTKLQEHINVLLNAPVSLQKHGIRLAFAKMKTEEILLLFSNIWKSTRNCTTRSELFTCVRSLLESETDWTMCKQVWEVLKTYISDLHAEENRVIYEKLGNFNGVPRHFLSEYYMKSYFFFKSLPVKANCGGILHEVISHASKFMSSLDHNFVANELLEHYYRNFANNESIYLNIISVYLLYSESRDIQMAKYNKVVAPVIEKSMPLWPSGQELNICRGFETLLSFLCSDFRKYNFRISPIYLFKYIQMELEKCLPPSKYYVMLTRWKLIVTYIEINDSDLSPSSCLYIDEKCANQNRPCLGHTCLRYFKHDLNRYFPSIYILFAYAINNLFDTFDIHINDKLAVVEQITANENDVQSYLLAIKILPNYDYHNNDVAKRRNTLLKKLYKNPDREVRMHFFKRFTHYKNS